MFSKIISEERIVMVASSLERSVATLERKLKSGQSFTMKQDEQPVPAMGQTSIAQFSHKYAVMYISYHS